MEGLALTGASVDHEKGLLSTIVLEMGGSSDLCVLLKPGEPVVLMGPTGTPTRNPREGNCCCWLAVDLATRCCSRLAQTAACRGFASDLFCRLQEDASIATRWRRSSARRMWWYGAAMKRLVSRLRGPGDLSFVGNIVDAMAAYGSGLLGSRKFRLARWIVSLQSAPIA